MKIYCEHCKEEISISVDSLFESYSVGKVQCPKCQKKQKRYISEADLLVYYGFSQVCYAIITIITYLLFRYIGIGVILIIVLLSLLVIYYFIQKHISRLVYEKAFFKENHKYHEFVEDQKAIQKNMQWQFMLFFAIAITFATGTDLSLFFGFMMIFCVGLTVIKIKLACRNEKNAVEETEKKMAK